MSKRATVWVTKYALTRGIFQVEVTIENGGYAHETGQQWTQYPPGTWFLTEPGAADDAEARRTRKIESLRKQIVKLEKIRFLGGGES